jgi:hypothetical protein
MVADAFLHKPFTFIDAMLIQQLCFHTQPAILPANHGRDYPCEPPRTTLFFLNFWCDSMESWGGLRTARSAGLAPMPRLAGNDAGLRASVGQLQACSCERGPELILLFSRFPFFFPGYLY